MRRRERGLRSRLAIALAVSSACAGHAAVATSRFYVGSGGNWNTTASWSATSGGASGASVPANSDDATINAPTTLTVPLDTSYASPGLANLNVGSTGGAIATVQQAAAGSAMYAVNENIGTVGRGSFDHKINSNTVTGTVRVGSGSANSGVYNLSGGGTVTANSATIAGGGTFNIGGTYSPATFQNINLEPGNSGVFTILADGSDDDTAAINLGANNFRYAGNAYSGAASLYVSSNGLLSLGAPEAAFSNTDLSSSPTSPTIAPLWDDWILPTGSNARVLGKFEDVNADTIPDRLIVEWSQINSVDIPVSPSTVTFQAILGLNSAAADGAITFNYVDLDSGNFASNGAFSTVGLRQSDNAQTLVSFDSDSNLLVRSGKAITFSSAIGPGTLTANSLTIDSGGTLNLHRGGVSTPSLSISGTLNVDGGALAATSISLTAGGKLNLAAGAGLNVSTSTLTIDNASKIDVADNKLIVTGTPRGAWNGTNYDGVLGMVRRGRNAGSWNGSGIITSMTAASGPGALTTLAVATAADVDKVVFGDVLVNPDDVLVMYTYAGDADLSGTVNGDDYFRIDAGYVAHDTGFANGDFDYSGRIDADDYWLIDHSYANQQGEFDDAPLPARANASASLQAVPEPGMLGLLGSLSLTLRRRRR